MASACGSSYVQGRETLTGMEFAVTATTNGFAKWDTNHEMAIAVKWSAGSIFRTSRLAM